MSVLTLSGCLAARQDQRAPTEAGATLIELLQVVAIMGTLLFLGVPSFLRLVDSTRLTAYANDFMRSMYLARSDALKRRGRAVVCKSTNGTSCAADGGWDQGWVVFRDANNNGVLDAGEIVLQHAPPLPSGFRFSGNATVASYISYAGTGRTRQTGGGFQAGTLTLCKVGAEALESRQIVINNAGRARVFRVSDENCPR